MSLTFEKTRVWRVIIGADIKFNSASFRISGLLKCSTFLALPRPPNRQRVGICHDGGNLSSADIKLVPIIHRIDMCIQKQAWSSSPRCLSLPDELAPGAASDTFENRTAWLPDRLPCGKACYPGR